LLVSAWHFANRRPRVPVRRSLVREQQVDDYAAHFLCLLDPVVFGFRPVLAPLFRSLVALKRLLNISTTGHSQLPPGSPPASLLLAQPSFHRRPGFGRGAIGVHFNKLVPLLFLSCLPPPPIWLSSHPNATLAHLNPEARLTVLDFHDNLTYDPGRQELSSLLSCLPCLFLHVQLSSSLNFFPWYIRADQEWWQGD
jgi:hypothetical protein